MRALRPATREGVYRAALQIVRLDRAVTPSEQKVLDHLRSGLGLDEATIRRIEKEAGGK